MSIFIRRTEPKRPNQQCQCSAENFISSFIFLIFFFLVIFIWMKTKIQGDLKMPSRLGLKTKRRKENIFTALMRRIFVNICYFKMFLLWLWRLVFEFSIFFLLRFIWCWAALSPTTNYSSIWHKVQIIRRQYSLIKNARAAEGKREKKNEFRIVDDV